MQRHTDRDYEHELDTLRERVLFMGAQVEHLVETAVMALQRNDQAQAAVAISLDEGIDRLEMEIDERSLRLLARRQPVASDLRLITTTLKLVTDLERAADLGVNVAERVVELTAFKTKIDVYATLERMADITLSMLRDSLDAFVSSDALKAEQVLSRDASVDALYSELFPELISQTVADIRNIEQATKLQSVGKYIERLADHATNIAEMVIFMVRGQDVRHHHFDPMAVGRA